jgi:hypothetical protein
MDEIRENCGVLMAEGIGRLRRGDVPWRKDMTASSA